MMLPKDEPYIVFADSYAEAFCANAFGDGVGLTKRRAGKVTTSQFKTALAAFADRTSITSFDEFRYFKHVTETGSWKDCSLLTSITLPRRCTELSNGSFENCSALERINLGYIEKMQVRSFYGCTNLRIGVDMPMLSNRTQSSALSYETFRGSGITKVTNLGTVTDIGEYSFFARCANLTEIWLPATLRSIARLSMYGCSALTTLVVLAETPPTLVAGAIDGASGMKIFVPYSADHSILDAYRTAENWIAYANDIVELNPDGTVPTEL